MKNENEQIILHKTKSKIKEKKEKVIPSDGGQSHDNTFTFLQFLKLKYN